MGCAQSKTVLLGCAHHNNSAVPKRRSLSDRDDGVCVLEIVRCGNLPRPDVGSSRTTDASVTCRFVEHEGGRVLGNRGSEGVRLQTRVQHDSLDPVFRSLLAFPFVPEEDGDTLRLEVKVKDDEDLPDRLHEDVVGRAEIPFRLLRSSMGEEITVEIELTQHRPSLHRCHSEEASTVTVRLVHLEHNQNQAKHNRSKKNRNNNKKPPTVRKEFFAVRHCESTWNESSQERHHVNQGLVVQQGYDHELTPRGIRQALEFNERWRDVMMDDTDHDLDTGTQNHDREDLQEFLSASTILSSPSTRAVQTALLACTGHPTLRTKPMVLSRTLREIRRRGACDTVGTCTGSDIERHVREMLTRDLAPHTDDDNTDDDTTDLPPVDDVLRNVEIDPYDAVDTWWNHHHPQDDESEDDVDQRCTELWTLLRYGTPCNNTASILVGHSHFFRHMCREYASPGYRTRSPEWTHLLDHNQLDHGSCLRVVVEWDPAQGPMEPPVIQSARLVFGSKLVKM